MHTYRSYVLFAEFLFLFQDLTYDFILKIPSKSHLLTVKWKSEFLKDLFSQQVQIQ